MTAAHRRHDMSDAVWERLKPICLEGRASRVGLPTTSRFIDAVCWILRTGSPWRDLPPDYLEEHPWPGSVGGSWMR